VEGSCEHGNVPSGSVKCWKFMSSCTTGSFSSRAQQYEVSQSVNPSRHMYTFLTHEDYIANRSLEMA
jgi:hypothetical protein